MNAQQIWIAYTTIVVKEVRRFARIWIQTIVPPVITTALYFVIFGNLIALKSVIWKGIVILTLLCPV